jgi:hypothetical protein
MESSLRPRPPRTGQKPAYNASCQKICGLALRVGRGYLQNKPEPRYVPGERQSVCHQSWAPGVAGSS